MNMNDNKSISQHFNLFSVQDYYAISHAVLLMT